MSIQPFLDLEIRNRLALYVAGGISLDQLREWFAPLLWDVEKTGNRAAIDLAYDVELLLAEFSHCDWTEQELRELLRPLSQTPEAGNTAPSPKIKLPRRRRKSA